MAFMVSGSASVKSADAKNSSNSNGHDPVAAMWAKRTSLVRHLELDSNLPVMTHLSPLYDGLHRRISKLKELKAKWQEDPTESEKNMILFQMANLYREIGQISLDNRVFHVASKCFSHAANLYDEVGYGVVEAQQCKMLSAKAEHLANAEPLENEL